MSSSYGTPTDGNPRTIALAKTCDGSDDIVRLCVPRFDGSDSDASVDFFSTFKTSKLLPISNVTMRGTRERETERMKD